MGDGGWILFACKKGGADVGKTKRGKGSKIMVMVDGQGIPVSTFVASAQVAEVNTIETLVDVRVCGREITRLIYDRAADADWLRDSLEHRGIELICPHRRGRKRAARQDGRSLRSTGSEKNGHSGRCRDRECRVGGISVLFRFMFSAATLAPDLLRFPLAEEERRSGSTVPM